MARSSNSPILAHLRSAKSSLEQIAALQALKNEIVGHIQKKEAWIKLGVLSPIVKSLAVRSFPTKARSKDVKAQPLVRTLSDEDGVKLQALQLLGSFANGGPSFLAPLNASDALPAILAHITPSTIAPQIVVAALRALTEIVEASILSTSSTPLDTQHIANQVFQPLYIDSMNSIISNSSPRSIQQSQVSLVAGLVIRLCREERHQSALVASGMLDLLATRLAGFAVGDGHVIPGADALARRDGLFEAFPDAASAGVKIGPILDAIAAVLGDSGYRAHRLVCSPSILAVFPAVKLEVSGDSLGSRLSSIRPGQQQGSAMELILPELPIAMAKGSFSHSSLHQPEHPDMYGSIRGIPTQPNSITAWASNKIGSSTSNGYSDLKEVETPLIPWLIHLARSRTATERLAAITVLTALFKAGLGSQGSREMSIGLLVVPILVDMIAKNTKENRDGDGAEARRRKILERAPAILARLITDSEYLQMAAFDCNAVRAVTRLLKRAYEPILTLSEPRYWSPHPDTDMDVETTSPTSQLGEQGRHPLVAHRVLVREATLKAIGALAAGKEEYRKCLVAEGIVPFVVDSLTESPNRPGQVKDRHKDKAAMITASLMPSECGMNPLPVLIAACHVIRTLARSVSILRTALVDNNVAPIIFRFMKHSDVNIQVASTATIINLVVEVSPVREMLTDNGVMRVLCEHAHSDNPALRLNALWALKHFVDAVGPDLKKACLEQLEPEWLIQLICDDSQHEALHNSRSTRTSGDDIDEEMDVQPSDTAFRWLCGSDGAIRELDASSSTKLRHAEVKLARVHELESNPARRARQDDVAVQEQGLDFIRNLIGRPGSSEHAEGQSETTEMIDHIFSVLGQDRLFDILATKLRAKVLHPFSRRAPVPGREARVVHPQPRIIAAVLYILVHIAASTPRHRQLVIAQTEVLKLLAQQSSSRDRDARLALCHLIINLTWQEDSTETTACVERVRELKKLGYQAKMESLCKTDPDLDVRERAKTATYQMEQLSY